MDNTAKTSADLEREVDEQRSRVEARIGEIRERLSPGQLLDEALSYSKNGGASFTSNFAQQISANPLPAALVGIGLAWLIGSSANSSTPALRSAQPARGNDEDDHPYARVRSAGLRRTSHAADEAGQWWSEFESDTGETYRAKATEAGERAGHFTDEAGKRFSGFIDDAGSRVRQFQDDAGNRLDDALGWTNHNWSKARTGIGNAVTGAADEAGDAGARVARTTSDFAGNVTGTIQSQTDQMGRQVVDLFKKQPLVAGALAFAAGAAVGALLPTTAQEDSLLGEQADRLRKQATQAAGDLYEKGKEQVSHAYDQATDAGAKLYESAKDQLTSNDPSALN